ncbi:MAG: 4Fe-4S binding protein [Collinsella sp.]|nr:4Fe-4S binding protein [Collinsella sp.]
MGETVHRIWVSETGCIGCRLCERACPCGAMHVEEKQATIDYELCISCGMCATKCRKGVIHDAFGLFAPAE